jgi:4-hydroxybenzoate polyprenyltransferase/phosphoserine phosphatase
VSDSKVPLVVDLDGTLVRTDLMVDSVIGLLVKRPLLFLAALASLLRGKAQFKEFLAKGFVLDPSALPFRSEVLDLIHQKREAGGEVVLATASAETIGHQVASALGLFSKVLTSTSTHNLSGSNKAQALVALFGARGFDYIGDSSKDIPVWEAARTPYLVGNNLAAGVAFNKLEGGIRLNERDRMRTLKNWAKALRLHQWSKNFLVFVPATAAHQILNPVFFLTLVFSFIAFGLVASAVYLINDVFDLQHDRTNYVKSKRPIARGDISVLKATSAALALIVSAATLSSMLPAQFTQALLGYFLITTAYTLGLKRILMVDVVTLAGLYTLRVVAGGLAVGITVSSWLLAFSFFMFLSLSFVKRSSELIQISREGGEIALGRAYRSIDLPVVNAMGVSSGLISVLVFALYLDSPVVGNLYETSQLLWGAVPILAFWISYVWVRAGRGEVNQDPVLFAVRDKVSLISGTLLLAVFLLAQSGLI